VQTVLAITHLLQVIPNFEEEEKAVASFSATRSATANQ
jgi:hypothetical protein